MTPRWVAAQVPTSAILCAVNRYNGRSRTFLVDFAVYIEIPPTRKTVFRPFKTVYDGFRTVFRPRSATHGSFRASPTGRIPKSVMLKDLPHRKKKFAPVPTVHRRIEGLARRPDVLHSGDVHNIVSVHLPVHPNGLCPQVMVFKHRLFADTECSTSNSTKTHNPWSCVGLHSRLCGTLAAPERGHGWDLTLEEQAAAQRLADSVG